MKPKSLGIAAAAALALVGLGLAIQKLRTPPEAAAHTGDLFFPELIDRINSVHALSVTTAEGAYRIERKDGRWVLAEKGGYPVADAQVPQTLIALAELEKVEPKTADPARYSELEVEDAPAAGSTSKLVTLRDDKDAEIATLIIGKRRSGGGPSSYYARKPGEAQSWLVHGELEIHDDGNAWLDKKILEVKRDEVRAVESTHPDGEALLVSKGKRDDKDFAVHDLPPERELKYATVANGMGSALEYLNLEDVVPAAEFAAPEGEPVRTSYWTFDGLRVDVALYEKDAKTYAKFHASYDAEGPPGLAVVGPLPGEPEQPTEGEMPATEEGAAPAEPEKPAVEPRPADEVKKEAEELDARLSPWVFQIPAYNKTNFTKRMADMLKELEPPAAPEGEGAPPSGGDGALFPPDDGAAGGDAAREELEKQMREFLEQQEAARAAEGAGETPEGTPPAEDPPSDAPPATDPPVDEPPVEKPTDDPAGGSTSGEDP